jgi:hypothetical protein
MEIDKNEDYTILNDKLSFNFVYSKDELAIIYTHRDRYKKGEAETFVVEDFVTFVRQNKNLNFE